MQSRNPFIDDLARVAEYAADAAFAAGKEAKSVVRGGIEEMASRLDLVSRQDLDTLGEQVRDTNAIMAALEERVIALEKDMTKSRKQRKPSTAKDDPD